MKELVYENDNRIVDVHRKPDPKRKAELRRKVNEIKERLKKEAEKTAEK